MGFLLTVLVLFPILFLVGPIFPDCDCKKDKTTRE